MDSIVWLHGRPRHYQHLVHWAGYNESKDMWLPEAELGNVPEVVPEVL